MIEIKNDNRLDIQINQEKDAIILDCYGDNNARMILTRQQAQELCSSILKLARYI